MSELKPCPFCGGKARVSEYHGDPKVACEDCGVFTLSPDAVKDWNTRPDSPALDRLKEAQAIIDRILELDAKATPGDWEQLSDGEDVGEPVEIRHRGAFIARVSGINDFPCLDHDDEQEMAKQNEEMRANADLIAEYRTLAPKLARALRIIEELKQ